MIDKTTEGIVAEPTEVEAVLHNLCGYHLAERDPAFRYTVLTREQVLYDALVQAIKRERGRALADMVAAGHTLTQVAEKTNLGSRQRVQRLIAISKAAEEAAAAVQAASREFEAKLAAVEATLDEVHSGMIPVVVDPPPPLPAAREPFEDVYAFDTDGAELDPFSAPTQMIAAIRPAERDEDTPWWRRSRDTGAA